MFDFVAFNGGSAKESRAMTLVALFLFFLPCFFSCSLIFPSPPALCRYLLPRLRVVSSVQQLSVPLQRVCCCSCGPSDLLASHYSELLSVYYYYTLSFSALRRYPLPRLRVVSPVQQLSVPFSTYVVLFAAFLILHHILQNSWSAFLSVKFSCLCFWSGLFCCVFVPGTLAFHLPYYLA